MNESVIIQKLIQVGQMLERSELEYSGAEADTKHYLEKYVALHQPLVISSFCHHNGTYTTVTDSNGNEVCCKCTKPLAK